MFLFTCVVASSLSLSRYHTCCPWFLLRRLLLLLQLGCSCTNDACRMTLTPSTRDGVALFHTRRSHEFRTQETRSVVQPKCVRARLLYNPETKPQIISLNSFSHFTVHKLSVSDSPTHGLSTRLFALTTRICHGRMETSRKNEPKTWAKTV